MLHYQLTAPYLVKKDGSIVFSALKAFALSGLPAKATDALQALSEGVEAQVYEKWRIQCGSLLQILESRDLVRAFEKPELDGQDEKTFNYLCAVSSAPKEAWGKIQSAHIVLLGCGGIGAVCAESLAGMGFRHFTCIDFDNVAPSNLNRQTLFCHEDIGQPKTQALKRRLLERRPQLEVETIHYRIESVANLRECVPASATLMLVGIDQPPLLSKIWSLEMSLERGLACIFTGVGLQSATVGPLLCDHASMRLYKEHLEREAAHFDLAKTRPILPSLGAANLTACAIVSHDIFRFVSSCEAPLTTNRQLLLKLNDLVSRVIYDGGSDAQ